MPLNIKKKISHCCDLVRDYDHDRYLTTLYAPPEKRPGLYALYAFNYEISKIRQMVSDPMLGQIRLQWWQDAVEAIYQSRTDGHDVVQSLAEAIGAHDLSRDIFREIIEGRRRDIENTSPENWAELADYLHKTAGNISLLAVHILGNRDNDDLARHMGMAWGYVGIIRAVTYHISLKKNYIPQDMMTKQGLTRFLDPDQPEKTKAVIRELCELAEENLVLIARNKKLIKPDSRSAFLLTSLTRSYLKTIEKADYNSFRIEEKPDAMFRQWRLITSALFNRI